MVRLVRDAAVGYVPIHLSNQVMKTIESDGIAAGLIHFMFCLLAIEVAAQLIKDWIG